MINVTKESKMIYLWILNKLLFCSREENKSLNCTQTHNNYTDHIRDNGDHCVLSFIIMCILSFHIPYIHHQFNNIHLIKKTWVPEKKEVWYSIVLSYFHILLLWTKNAFLSLKIFVWFCQKFLSLLLGQRLN